MCVAAHYGKIINCIALTQSTDCTFTLHIFYSRSLCCRGHILCGEIPTLVRETRSVCVHCCVHSMSPAHSALPSIGPDSSGPPCSGVGVGEQALKEALVTHYPTIQPPFMSSTPPKQSPSSPQPLTDRQTDIHTHWRNEILFQWNRDCVDRTAVKDASVCVCTTTASLAQF